jgi:hypothetical protein
MVAKSLREKLKNLHFRSFLYICKLGALDGSYEGEGEVHACALGKLVSRRQIARLKVIFAGFLVPISAR